MAYLKPHQTLAINRGEALKILSVKIIPPESLKIKLKEFIESQYLQSGIKYKERYEIFQAAFNEAFTKKCNLIQDYYIVYLFIFFKF